MKLPRRARGVSCSRSGLFGLFGRLEAQPRDVALESFVAGLAFRSVDFSQGGTTFNDSDTRIVDLSVGYR